MKYLPLIWRNLLRKKVRTFLTLLSIFVAFMLYGVLVAVETGFTAGVELAGLDRMITIHKVSIIQDLPYRYLRQIENVEGVAGVAHASWFGGIYQDQKNFFAKMAVSPERYLEIFPEIRLSDAERQAWLQNRIGAIAGRPLAERFGWEIGERIPIQGDIYRTPDDSAWEFVLEGIYEPAKGFDGTQFFFHYDYLKETNAFADGRVGWYILKIEDTERSAEIAGLVDELFANSADETKTTTEKAFAQGFANQVGDIGRIVTSVLAVVFFTLLLVAGNTVAQSVRERTGELGVLKTLGFTDTQVMGMVLAEAYLLVGLGGGLALLVVTAAMATIEEWGGAILAVLPVVYLPNDAILRGVILLLLMGFAAGALPAFQALRLDIVEALRKN